MSQVSEPLPTRRRLSAIALCTAALLLLAGLAVALYSEQFYRHAREAELTAQAHILAATVTAAVAFHDHDAAQEYVAALAGDPSIQAAAIYTDDKPFVAFRRANARPLPPDPNADDEPGRLSVSAPVLQGGQVLGYAYVRSLTDPLILRLQRYAAILLLAVMAALVVVVLGMSQAALTRANADLSSRAAELALTNVRLEEQIARREEIEEALRQSQKMEAIGQLTGGIAHDFNNLLQVVLGNLDLMARRLRAEDDDLRRRLHSAQNAGERAATLTRQLLAFARRQALAPQLLDMHKLIGGLATLLHRTLGEAIAIETRVAAGIWHVMADANQLENALLNLAVNARDAMPEGGRLDIETHNITAEAGEAPGDLEPGQYVSIAVSDTGSGMSRDVATRAFEPFFTTKGIGKGTGLGLSQVYGFVKQSGGHARIESTKGKGTTVRLFLPRHVSQAADAERPAAAAVPGTSAGELVLLVEDDDGVRASSREMLRELGYGVVEAADGYQALQLIGRTPGIRLLFSDIGLPGGLNGRQLAKEMQKLRPDLPVLLTTGYAHDALTQEGSSDLPLITKPFSYSALAQKLRQVLDTVEGAARS